MSDAEEPELIFDPHELVHIGDPARQWTRVDIKDLQVAKTFWRIRDWHRA